ncbi:MAG: UDP-N-acetylmuramoyl-tripeptide--D-alanyl-D-alanine ligase [Thermodesulfovibrionales bacterium]|nr:UDP-N-acetylmuramoyl-tripeptide--D-alanyl-D-alanine ligase [Thermodesulfovibrionales bacterium]
MGILFTSEDIIKATQGFLAIESCREFTGISIDSRTINDGELFIALKGDNFDGHDFVKEALKRGSGVVVKEEWFKNNIPRGTDKTYIIVKNTLRALQDIAAFLRGKFNGQVIAVVGSNGKTTTKEILADILEGNFKILKTKGNLNNHIGMPLCMCQLDKDKEILLVEMGTNKPGDISDLCRIALPHIAVITNIGYEHIEGFGSLEGVRESEFEILPFVSTVIVNNDDKFLMEGLHDRYRGKVITFGINHPSDVYATNIDLREGCTSFCLNAIEGSIDVESKLTGIFNLYNCLAASAAALYMGLNLEEIKRGIESFQGVRLRFEIRRLNGATLLYDVYNANPSSMEASINEMVRIFYNQISPKKYNRMIAVLGDMLELGNYSIRAHENLGKYLSDLNIDIFIAVGKRMKYALTYFKGIGYGVDDSTEGGKILANFIKEGDLVLIKGSRGMKMENVLSELERNL